MGEQNRHRLADLTSDIAADLDNWDDLNDDDRLHFWERFMDLHALCNLIDSEYPLYYDDGRKVQP